MKRKLFFTVLFFSALFVFMYNTPKVSASDSRERTVIANPGATAADIQSLLDYNQSGSYDDLTVVLPDGEYILEKELRIYSNTTILADKNAVIKKNHTNGSIIANDLSKDKGGYSATSNITISGGTWDASPVANENKGTECFRFIHAKNVTVKNLTMCNVPDGSHMITFAGVYNGVVDNCKLYGYNGSLLKEAIHLDIVHNSKIVPSTQSNLIVYDDLPCDTILIKNCEIYNYSRAIGSHSSIRGVYHKNITITNNTLHDLQEAAIKVYNYVNVEISGNTIYNASIGILAYTYLSGEENHYYTPLATTKESPTPSNYNILIKNNTIYDIQNSYFTNHSTWGDGINILGSSSRPLKGVRILDNNITTVKRYGVYLKNAPNNLINNNTIKSTTNNGIYLMSESNYTRITENTLSDTGSSTVEAGGIRLDSSSYANIYSNTINNANKWGISLYNSSKYATINNNTITSPGLDGIILSTLCNNAIISSNTINAYNQFGIFINDTDLGEIRNNKIYGSKTDSAKDGIHISGMYADNGIFILYKNYVENSLRHGIYIDGVINTRVNENTIVSANNTPIFLSMYTASSIIKSNTIK